MVDDLSLHDRFWHLLEFQDEAITGDHEELQNRRDAVKKIYQTLMQARRTEEEAHDSNVEQEDERRESEMTSRERLAGLGHDHELRSAKERVGQKHTRRLVDANRS